MPQTTITPQTCALTGLNVALAAANADGSKFANPTDQTTFLLVENSNASARDLVVVTQATSVRVGGYGSQTLSNRTIVIPANTGKVLIGPFPPAQFNDSDGNAHITFSGVTNLTIAAVRLARV